MSTTGEILRRAREQKGISLDEAASRTKLKRDVLEALEQDDLDRLTSRSYAPFFIKSYSRYLGIAAPTADDAAGGDRGSRRRGRRRAPRSGGAAGDSAPTAPGDAGPPAEAGKPEQAAVPGGEDLAPAVADDRAVDGGEPASEGDLFDTPRPRARPRVVRNTPRRTASGPWGSREIAIAVSAAVVIVVAAVIFWPRGGGESDDPGAGAGPVAEEPAAGGGPYELMVRADRVAAVRITSGGEVLYDGVMATGERQHRTSQEPFRVWASPAAAVQLFGNKRRLDFAGEGAAERTWPGPGPERAP